MTNNENDNRPTSMSPRENELMPDKQIRLLKESGKKLRINLGYNVQIEDEYHKNGFPVTICKIDASQHYFSRNIAIVKEMVELWNTRPQPSADLEQLMRETCVYSDRVTMPIPTYEALKQALTQPKAVDVDLLRQRIPKGASIQGRRWCEGWNECLDYLFEQGYLNTNERVQELEEKLKVATEALKKLSDRVVLNFDESVEGVMSVIFDKVKIAEEAIQQIEGGRDE